MKQFVLILAAFFAASFSFAQSNVYLKINHQLGGSPFQFNTPSANNNGVQFDIDRMQYYVSEVTLIHDGGVETMVPNTWFLVNAGNAFNEMLGSFTITNLEAVRFGIGVDSAHNHLDPSTYASGHPLAPQAPSMHWGWQAGYRFAAIEGSSGQGFNQFYEIHALGDIDYYWTSIPTTGTLNGSDLTIELDADYARVLENIDVSTGTISHGTSQITREALTNFRDYVFTAAGTTTSLDGALSESAINLSVYPNPSQQSSTVTAQGDFPVNSVIRVFDLNGRVVLEKAITGQSTTLELNTAGFYLVSVYQDLNLLSSKKLIITQ